MGEPGCACVQQAWCPCLWTHVTGTLFVFPGQWSDIQPAKRNAPQPTQFYGQVDNATFALMTSYWIDNYLLVRSAKDLLTSP